MSEAEVPNLNCQVNDWANVYLGDMDATWNPISLTHVIYPQGV